MSNNFSNKIQKEQIILEIYEKILLKKFLI